MNNIDIKTGDFVKLRDDLEDLKEYGEKYYNKSEMEFEDFRKVIFVDIDKTFHLDGKDDYNYTKEMITEIKRPCRYKTIYKRKETILDDVEKKYLSTVIRPFRDKINSITKYEYESFNEQYILIRYDEQSIIEQDSIIKLPDFKKNTMYKGMIPNKKYTLKELGL